MKNVEIYIDGKEKTTKNDIFSSFSKQLGFPVYFGNNFDAFWDILSNKDFDFKGEISITIINKNKFYFSDDNLGNTIFLEIINDLKNINGYKILIK